jgi:hypothetical protein
MATIQQLLNQEAGLANNGHEHSPLRVIIWEEIRQRRGPYAPECFGHDDCSTLILSQCPWRMDCGTQEE